VHAPSPGAPADAPVRPSRGRLAALPFVVAGLTAAALASGSAAGAAAGPSALSAQARAVAVEFFRSQNERRYDDTCRLLSHEFYESHGLRDRRTCAAVLRVAFVWSGKIDFQIGRATREGDRVVVRAVADGAPGRIVLVRESGALRILALEDGSAEDTRPA